MVLSSLSSNDSCRCDGVNKVDLDNVRIVID